MSRSLTTIENLEAAVDLPGLPRVSPPDRLPPMLFLAALLHGILIIGVTFNAVLGNEFEDAISLEVTIVADPERSIERSDDAAYLAQSSQRGVGNTREAARPESREQSVVPVDNPGETEGNSVQNALTHRLAADQTVATRSEHMASASDKPRDEPEPEERTAIALRAGTESPLPLPRDTQASALIHDDDPRQLITSVDTKESNVAGYLDRWKRKIESIGMGYFPEVGISQGLTGSPTLEVTIDASGQLDEVIVRRSSGSPILDQAALNILRRAAPFEPFPEAIRLDYDRLRFAYKWQFREGGAETTASTR
ncbi:MAG: energy transducer TonB [Woeseiaceae bacterium]